MIIVGHYSSLNKGEASIIKSMIKNLKEIIPGTEIVILSFFPEFDSERYGVKVLKDMGAVTRLRFPLHLVWFLLFKFLRKRADPLAGPLAETMREFCNADVVLINSGDILSTLYRGRTLSLTFYILFARSLQKPIVIYAHTIGPFGRLMEKIIWRFGLNMTDLITVRDEASEEYLSEMGVDRPHIKLTADPAFLLQPASPQRVREILLKEAVNLNDRPLFGICLSQLIYRYGFPELTNLTEKRRRYEQTMTKLIDYLTEELKGTVVLVPHVFGPGEHHDDRGIIRAIFKKVARSSKVRPIYGEYEPEEIKAIIGQFDVFITTRMHPLIHAISMNVPSIAVEYNHKTVALMQMLGQEKNVCHIKTLDLDDLKTMIHSVYSRRDALKKELRTRIETMEERARLNALMVKSLLKEKGIL